MKLFVEKNSEMLEAKFQTPKGTYIPASSILTPDN